ncbi:MAG: hypothetical protein CME88_13180 [Hirschia sp.]|nr:hypothetical protein [Hirschia sp.]MBF19322.1 hypothetical protein [Hirschia sp.]
MICMTGRFIIFALAITAFAVPAHAQFSPPGATWNGGGTESGRRSVSQSEAREAVEQGRAMPSHRIRQQLVQRYGGDMTDADMYVEGSRYFYTIRWTTRRGERLKLTVDARSARVLSEGR